MSNIRAKKNTGGSGSPIIKRKQNKALAIFVDGVGLDRACRRIKKRVDWRKLLKELSSGKRIIAARYYNLLPNSDDNRQVSFLENVTAAGFEAVIKRLPPKHIERQVSINTEMASDLVAFGLGQISFPELHYFAVRSAVSKTELENPVINKLTETELAELTNKEVIIVCPSKELEYPVSYLNSLGVRTFTADFGKFTMSNTLTASNDWIDLTESENIWL